MLNALTVDVEDWYHTNGLNIPKSEWDNLPSTVYENTIKLLNIFDEFEVKATFFILGDVAKTYPHLVKEIVKRGHEIGSHGMNHQLVYKQTVEEFKADVLESIEILKEMSGQNITLYRAPSWSISEDRLEVLEFLEQSGILVDSSLQPFKTPLSGMSGIPTHPFKPVIGGKSLDLVEFPPTVMQLSKNLTFPFAGGFYLRFFPYLIISKLLERLNKQKPGLVYVHPWELDPTIPKRRTSWFIYIIQYYRLNSTEKKLRNLLCKFKFAPIGKVLEQQEIIHKKL
jgi:polysaccharide deacetylase family protein (PEP-CTERM system associated)